MKPAAYFAVCVVAWAGALHAQTPPHSQAVNPADPCAGISSPSSDQMYSCGSDASLDGNKDIALKWWLRSAAHHNWEADFRLGYAYRDGSGVARDLIEAYKWFDVAAADHAAAIDKQGAAPNKRAAEDNSAEIRYRDQVGGKLAPEQIEDAQKRARDWLSAH